MPERTKRPLNPGAEWKEFLVLLLGADAGRLAVLARQEIHSCPLCRGPGDEIGEVGVLKLELNVLVQVVVYIGAPGRAWLDSAPP